MTGKLEMRAFWRPGGGTFANSSCGFTCWWQTCFSKPISHNYPPVSIPILKEKHPILLKLGVFYHNLLKIHPIHVIWALHLWWKHTKYREIAPEKGDTYTFTTSMWDPPVWRTQWSGWRRVAERKRRRNSGGGKRKEWTFEFDRHNIRSWWNDL